ncbi:MAG TPA: hypothetical protein VKF59_11830 [Candidatus Dormibacteraeota bacterium]|nr:hypothetical protein [Candidatus Dormibacteraeota bacterium]
MAQTAGNLSSTAGTTVGSMAGPAADPDSRPGDPRGGIVGTRGRRAAGMGLTRPETERIVIPRPEPFEVPAPQPEQEPVPSEPAPVAGSTAER